MDRDFYTTTDLRSPETLERLVLERITAWRPVEARPGAVILFEVYRRPVHVGLVLSRSDFVHSYGGQETTILRLDNPSWSDRIRGYYDTADSSVYRP